MSVGKKVFQTLFFVGANYLPVNTRNRNRLRRMNVGFYMHKNGFSAYPDRAAWDTFLEAWSTFWTPWTFP